MVFSRVRKLEFPNFGFPHEYICFHEVLLHFHIDFDDVDIDFDFDDVDIDLHILPHVHVHVHGQNCLFLLDFFVLNV